MLAEKPSLRSPCRGIRLNTAATPRSSFSAGNTIDSPLASRLSAGRSSKPGGAFSISTSGTDERPRAGRSRDERKASRSIEAVDSCHSPPVHPIRNPPDSGPPPTPRRERDRTSIASAYRERWDISFLAHVLTTRQIAATRWAGLATCGYVQLSPLG